MQKKKKTIVKTKQKKKKIHFFVESKLFQKRKPTNKLHIIFKSDRAVLFNKQLDRTRFNTYRILDWQGSYLGYLDV